MIKRLLKLLVICSMVTVIISSIEIIEAASGSDTQSSFQTMSHGVGGS